jgi:motility quorum-sensing regulator/GCU-specific mRNA interferase toxin
MEKRTPHSPLVLVKKLVQERRVRFTRTAIQGAACMGLRSKEILAVISALTMRDFYKSMTTHADHRIWQDVYRPETEAGAVYLKPTVVEDLLVVSFKEL